MKVSVRIGLFVVFLPPIRICLVPSWYVWKIFCNFANCRDGSRFLLIYFVMKNLFNIYLRSLITCALAILTFAGVSAADNYVVVIDAGHGGKDHGAIDNNVREKDINLGVALKAGELIKKQNKNIKVVYTRDKDEYLTLQQRADKANKSKGDLFISIHTNSVDKTNPNRTTVAGASTYTLGLHKEGSNMDVAKRENSVMTLEKNYETKYSGFDPNSDESYIIFEMAQKSNMTQSTKFAKEMQRQLTGVAKRRDRGVHQAGFWVLWATSMPAVLVELDFICNPNSAKYLNSSSGQNEMAKAIANATSSYFKSLSQHKKNRLKADAEDDNDSDEGFSEGTDGVMLAAVSSKTPKKTVAADKSSVPAERTRRPGTRRRRSDASREKSERQEYAVAVIQEEDVYVDTGSDKPEIVEPAEPVVDKEKKPASKKSKAARPAKRASSASKTTLASNSKKPAAKNDAAKKETETKANIREIAVVKPRYGKKNTSVSSTTSSAVTEQNQSAESNNSVSPKVNSKDNTSSSGRKSSSPARLQKIATVYKIQILASTERLKANNTLFCGLSPVTCIKDGETYKYLYGESTNRNEIYQLLSDVQKDIPDAVVIKVKKGVNAQ